METGRTRSPQRRRELLMELLELMEEEAGELSPAETRMLARELKRMGRGRQGPGLLESELVRGLLWGAGLTALAFLLVPQVKKSVRPLAVAAAGSVMDLMENGKELLANAGEGLEDVIAEAQFQRMQEAVAGEAATPKTGP